MGGVFHNMQWWWDYFKQLFHIKTFYITGSITLAAGEQQVGIPSDLPNPVRVYLSVEEPDDGGITTCLGDLNWVAARLLPNGFLLYADIKSDSCTINYVIEYDEDPDHGHGNNPIVIGGDN